MSFLLFQCSKVLPCRESSLLLCHSFRVDLLATNSLSFPSFESVLIFPLYLKGVYSYRSLRLLDLSVLEKCVTSFCLPHILIRNLLSGLFKLQCCRAHMSTWTLCLKPPGLMLQLHPNKLSFSLHFKNVSQNVMARIIKT